MPRRAQISSVSRCMQIALEPARSALGCCSKISTRTPYWARRPASVMPTAPAPMTATSAPGSVGERVPDLPVPIGGPDPRMLDAIELIPRALDVERHGVLENRESRVPRRERGVDLEEGLLQPAVALLHAAGTLQRGAQ